VADTDTRSTTARLRYVRTSPPKMRQVLELIRGQDVETARDTLRFCERAAARDVVKLLDSAVANAEHNDQIPEEELFVARAHADEGPTLKRWRPRARGRGVRIRKRTSHITIVLSRFAGEDLERRRRADAASGRRARRPARRRPAAPPPEELEAAPEEELEAASGDAAAATPEADTAAPAAAAPAATTARKPTAKQTTARKTTAKKTTAKKTTAKKTTAKKTTAKKATGTTKKAGEPAKQATPRKRRPNKPKDED
jgi:large subunit ribosomal protein L22